MEALLQTRSAVSGKAGPHQEQTEPQHQAEARPSAGQAGVGGDVEPRGVGPGEIEPGEAKPGEAKPGEAKPGEAKPGEAKPGEAKRRLRRCGGELPAGHRSTRSSSGRRPMCSMIR